MLELRQVCKRFAAITAVDNVSFSARAGEVTGVSRSERFRKVDDDENDHRPDREHLRGNPG